MGTQRRGGQPGGEGWRRLRDIHMRISECRVASVPDCERSVHGGVIDLITYSKWHLRYFIFKAVTVMSPVIQGDKIWTDPLCSGSYAILYTH